MPEPPEENDPLETLLKERIEYIEDAGFTDRVLQALPSRRPSLARRLILLAASAIGVAMAVWWLPWDQPTSLSISGSILNDTQQLGTWLPVCAVLFSLGWAVINALSDEPYLF
jgi:hypothetical protein